MSCVLSLVWVMVLMLMVVLVLIYVGIVVDVGVSIVFFVIDVVGGGGCDGVVVGVSACVGVGVDGGVGCH